LRGDYVQFIKGCTKNLPYKKWDIIYISTLFTFYWNITIKTIRHYLDFVKQPSDIYVGGVMATLLDKEIESEIGKSLMTCDPNGHLAFVVTKIVVDKHAGEIAAGRMFSGTIKQGQDVYLNGAKKTVRVQQVNIYKGATRVHSRIFARSRADISKIITKKIQIYKKSYY